MHRDARGIDLVVGAKGSPMQIILSAIYHLDVPTGNIPLAQAKEIAQAPHGEEDDPARARRQLPGLSHRRHQPRLRRALRRRARRGPAVGEADGSRARRRGGARAPGSASAPTSSAPTASASGGAEHGDAPYKVVGVLAPTGTVLDRLVLSSVESVWWCTTSTSGTRTGRAATRARTTGDHGAPHPVRDARSPPRSLPRYINNNSEMQAASPAYETARLFSIIGVGVDVLRGFALVLICRAGLSVFIALYNALRRAPLRSRRDAHARRARRER